VKESKKWYVRHMAEDKAELGVDFEASTTDDGQRRSQTPGKDASDAGGFLDTTSTITNGICRLRLWFPLAAF
jgi:hypothetical protein